MNKRNFAILSAVGFACSGFAMLPASADPVSPEAQPQTIAKLPGASCSVGGKGFKGGKMFDFSDEQLEKLSSLKTKMKETSGPKYLELMKLKTELRDKLTKEEVNKSEVLAIQSKVNDLKAELANERLGFMVDASSVLTAEQKQSMRRRMLMKNVMGGHHGGKRGHGKWSHSKRGKHMKGSAGTGGSVTGEASGLDNGAELG